MNNQTCSSGWLTPGLEPEAVRSESQSHVLPSVATLPVRGVLGDPTRRGGPSADVGHPATFAAMRLDFPHLQRGGTGRNSDFQVYLDFGIVRFSPKGLERTILPCRTNESGTSLVEAGRTSPRFRPETSWTSLGPLRTPH